MSDIRIITNRYDIVAIADAVRSKIGSNEDMTMGEIARNISKIVIGDGVNATFGNCYVYDDGNGNVTIVDKPESELENEDENEGV
jgi:hypothetical protein